MLRHSHDYSADEEESGHDKESHTHDHAAPADSPA
jgi:hypothetical protein